MLRSVYRCLLRLHPPVFRQRFAEEMLSIFDQAQRKRATVGLLVDGFLSLTRQWALRPEFWRDTSPAPMQQTASDGIPSFYTLDPFRPRTAAVIHGLVLSAAIFCMTCFAIRYSGIHILHVHIPHVEFEAPSAVEPGVPTPTMPEEPGTQPHWENRTADDAVGSSRVASHKEARAPNPTAQLSQKEARAATPAPSGRASNVLLQPVPQMYAAQKGAARPAGLVGFVSRENARAQSEPRQQELSGAIAPAEVANLDAAERRRVIDGAVAYLTRYYVDAKVAQKMAAALRAHERNGDDDGATDGPAFADLVTLQMQDVSHDNYVVMLYGSSIAPETPGIPTAADIAAYRKEMERTNCGFEIVRLLPHNIGYLKFNSFADAAICGPTAAAAMAKLNGADAIIFDLRDNPGGYANMVALIATYLFDRPTHLNDFYNRAESSTEQSWTLPPVPGSRLADKPALVLTSHRTFSAAEAFSYDLKMLKRVTLVGERTSGRGHMGIEHRIDDHFTIRIPGIKVINPISKSNWEGTGVEPDVRVNATDALATAEKLAEEKLR